ncbi:MAG: hypothetical protein ACJ74J_15085 [Blastocatellia bacterium]
MCGIIAVCTFDRSLSDEELNGLLPCLSPRIFFAASLSFRPIVLRRVAS